MTAEEVAGGGPVGGRGEAIGGAGAWGRGGVVLEAMPGSDRVYLDVPYAEKDAAKRAGARWDPDARRWYAGPNAGEIALARWLPRAPVPSGPRVPVRVYALPQRCYRCGHPTRCIVGVVAPSVYTGDLDGFVPIDDCADALASVLPPQQLAQQGVGVLRRRSSRVRPEGYTANGCVHCDAIMGNFPLREDLLEWLSSGRRVTDLDLVATVLLPVGALAESA